MNSDAFLPAGADPIGENVTKLSTRLSLSSVDDLADLPNLEVLEMKTTEGAPNYLSFVSDLVESTKYYKLTEFNLKKVDHRIYKNLFSPYFLFEDISFEFVTASGELKKMTAKKVKLSFPFNEKKAGLKVVKRQD